MTSSPTPFEGATHRAICGTHIVYFDGLDSFDDACDQAVKANGGGVPKVEPISNGKAKPTNGGNGKAAAIEKASVEPEPESTKTVERGVGHVDTAGKLRSMVDFAAAKAAGFAPKQSDFERGTRVVEYGVQEAKRVRAEYDAMPKVSEYATDFIERIEGENRDVTDIEAAKIRMTKTGEIGVVRSDAEKFAGPRLPLDERSFSSLLTHLRMAGSRYLITECWPELRAININHQMKALAEYERREHRRWSDNVDANYRHGMSADKAEKEAGREPTPKMLRLLTRKNVEHEAGREIYGVVTPSYQHGFGMDKVAEALAKAMPEDARGEVSYDGRRARFRVLFHTNVAPSEFVSGEFFRAGIGVRTDDSGGGSCIVDGMFWQNLCLNLIHIDEGVTEIKRIRHVGSVEALAEKFEDAMQKALASISHFIDAWGYGTQENVLEQTLRVTSDVDDRKKVEKVLDGSLPVSAALPGLFNGIMERELVPVRGKAKNVVPKLIEMYERDESGARFIERDDGSRIERPLTRTAVVNAFTRYAHEGQTDPWAQDEIQSAAGRLLFGKKVKGEGGRPATWKVPEPLPYIPLTV